MVNSIEGPFAFLTVMILLVFSQTFMLFGTSGNKKNQQKRKEGCHFFDFRDLRFEIDSNVFLDHFGGIFGLKVDPKSCKNHVKMMLKKRLHFNMIF